VVDVPRSVNPSQTLSCISVRLGSIAGPRRVIFTLIPKTVGPLVPAVAIESDASGSSFVTMANGSRTPVSIVVTSGGSAIVSGINVGDEILLP